MQKALFLDRDGVVNIEKNYLYKVEDFEFVDGIISLCRYYQNKGYKIFIVTNQSGIARGYYSEDDFAKLTKWMIKRFADNGIEITKVYHCPHHPEIDGECECRKPKPKMLLDAKDEFDIDMQNSIMVGDKSRDIQAALNAGIKKTYLFDISGENSSQIATKTVHTLDEIRE